MNVYTDSEDFKLSSEDAAAFLQRHTERVGRPQYAVIHSRNARLKPVLEAEGLTVRFVNGCLANELWLGNELPPVCFEEPFIYGKSSRRQEPPSDMPSEPSQEPLALAESDETQPPVLLDTPNFETPDGDGGNSGRKDGPSRQEGVSKINRGRPKREAMDEQIQKLASQELSTRQIAEKLGMSHVTVSRRLKALNASA